MSILSTIAEKIKPTQANNQESSSAGQPPTATLTETPNKKSTLQILESILEEVKKISGIIAAGEAKEGPKLKRVEKIKPKPLAKPVKKPPEETAKKDAEKVSKKPARKKKKEPAPSPFIKSAEAPISAAPAQAPAPLPPQEDKKGILDGLIETLKSLFLPIIAAGGIGAFLSGMFTMILEGLGMGEKGGFFDTLTTTIKNITTPIVWTFENVIKPVATVILTAVKEFVLGIGLAWDEAKLLMLGSGPVAWGIRKIFGVEGLDKKEEEALKKKIYDAKMRREQRMAGYVETVTGKRPAGAPPAAAPAPTPTVTKPAPTPAMAAAPPPSATRAPAVAPSAKPKPAAAAPTPAPTTKPAVAAPAAAPPPAAGPIPPSAKKPTEPTLGPPKKPPSPSFQEGKKMMLAAMDKEGIKDPIARAQILAQTAHESGSFRYTQELGNAQYFQRYEGRKDLGNINPGDGLRYIGRGFLQTTGRVNYQQFKDAFGVDVVANPEILAEPQYAAQSALFWFKKNAKKVEKLSGGDWSNTKGVTLAVNGGYNGLDDRLKYFEKFKNDPEVTGVPAGTASGGMPVTPAPTTGQAINVASAEVGSEKARSRQPTVNVTYVDATKVTTATKTVYS